MATITPDILSVGVSLPDTYFQPITIRQRIMNRLEQRLKRILVANGYFSNGGQTVIYGQLTEPNPDKTKPSIYAWDGDESNEREYGNDVIEMDVTVSMFELKPDHKEIPLEIFGNKMLGDLKRGMIRDDAGRPDPTVDKLASNLVYVSGTIQPGLRDVPWVNTLTQWTVTYISPTEDPCFIKSQSV